MNKGASHRSRARQLCALITLIKAPSSAAPRHRASPSRTRLSHMASPKAAHMASLSISRLRQTAYGLQSQIEPVNGSQAYGPCSRQRTKPSTHLRSFFFFLFCLKDIIITHVWVSNFWNVKYFVIEKSKHFTYIEAFLLVCFACKLKDIKF